MSSRIVLLYILLITVNLTVQVPDSAADNSSSIPPVKIGAIYGLTGLLPDLGDSFLKGSQLYFDIQPRGSNRISLTIEDSRWDSKTAVSAFQKLASVEGVRVVHVMGSGPSLAIKPLSESRNILLFSAGAHPQLLPGSSLIIRHANLASEDADSFAQSVAKEGAAVVATIFLQNDWGVSFQDAFEKTLGTLAPSSKVISQSHLVGEADFRTVLLKLLTQSPSVLVINSTGSSLVSIIEQARQLGFRGKIYCNNGLALSHEAQKRVRRLHDDKIYYQRYPLPPEEFTNLYLKHFNAKPEYFSLVSFTDLELINYAVSTVGSAPHAIVAFIKRLGSFQGRFASLKISPEGDILIPTLVQKFA